MNNIIILNRLTENEINQLLCIWKNAVRATHTFLSESDIQSLIPLVKEGVTQVQKLCCIKNTDDQIQGFIGVDCEKIEMLFIHNDYRGNGLGKQFTSYAIKELGVKYVDVNEQNPEAIGFYEHLGFTVFDRSELDEQGNPFPILHMKLNSRQSIGRY